MVRALRRLSSFSMVVLTAACAGQPAQLAPAPQAPDADFAEVVERLSEPGGFFPSDNLVSNETSYLHVLGAMRDVGVAGGAYVGVGPDQSFSYIANIRPHVAFIIDIRRDNLLHHLLFKALFENARNRLEYLCLMVGREVPRDLAKWDAASIDQIVDYVDAAPRERALFDANAATVRVSVQRYGIPLTEPDLTMIRSIQEAFHQRGLDIRYSSSVRHPTWRSLLLEKDLSGVQRNYLADEESFRFLKELQRMNRVIPVVGDLGGQHALAAVGQEIAGRGLRVSAFYVSNVEQYLFRGQGFERFAETVGALPYDSSSVIIRSYFGRIGGHPLSIPGHTSTQLLERVASFVDAYRGGAYRGYMDVVTRNVLPLRN